jgi:hypothetical protein
VDDDGDGMRAFRRGHPQLAELQRVFPIGKALRTRRHWCVGKLERIPTLRGNQAREEWDEQERMKFHHGVSVTTMDWKDTTY